MGLDDRLELARVGVDADEFDALCAAHEGNLLLLCAAEVADAGERDGARREERLGVEVDHGGVVGVLDGALCRLGGVSWRASERVE